MVNKTSVLLQSYNTDLNSAILALKTLKSSIMSLREEFSDYKDYGKKKSGCDVYERSNKRKCKTNVRLNPLGHCQTEVVTLTDSENFRINCFIPIVDKIISSLSERIAAYTEVESIFGL